MGDLSSEFRRSIDPWVAHRRRPPCSMRAVTMTAYLLTSPLWLKMNLNAMLAANLRCSQGMCSHGLRSNGYRLLKQATLFLCPSQLACQRGQYTILPWTSLLEQENYTIITFWATTQSLIFCLAQKNHTKKSSLTNEKYQTQPSLFSHTSFPSCIIGGGKMSCLTNPDIEKMPKMGLDILTSKMSKCPGHYSYIKSHLSQNVQKQRLPLGCSSYINCLCSRDEQFFIECSILLKEYFVSVLVQDSGLINLLFQLLSLGAYFRPNLSGNRRLGLIHKTLRLMLIYESPDSFVWYLLVTLFS